VVGRRIEQIDLPRGAAIGAIVRRRADSVQSDDEAASYDVIIAHHDTVIQAEDHVIVFLSNKRLLPRVEKLFQVGVGFF
jgi:trk system potassium uptake protein TrkA